MPLCWARLRGGGPANKTVKSRGEEEDRWKEKGKTSPRQQGHLQFRIFFPETEASIQEDEARGHRENPGWGFWEQRRVCSPR